MGVQELIWTRNSEKQEKRAIAKVAHVILSLSILVACCYIITYKKIEFPYAKILQSPSRTMRIFWIART